MESYDVVIVGGGIAGTTLSKDLSEDCPKKSILLLDNNSIGSNRGYGIRLTFRDSIKKYKLPYVRKYTSKVGVYDEVCFSLNEEVYLLDYKQVCNNRKKHSDLEYRSERAIDVNGNILTTDKARYRFDHLVDSSGSEFFLRRKFNWPMPFIFWLVDSKVLQKNFNLRDIGLSDKFCYIFFSDTDFVEDFYPLKDKVMEGEWAYTTEYNFSDIKPHNRTIIRKIPNLKILERNYTSVPVSPVLPLTFKKYACLGDSFGNANPNVGGGIDIISESSKMLSNAIKKDNLSLFEKQWKKKYLEVYTRTLASKLDRYGDSHVIKKIQNYPALSSVIRRLGDYPDFFQSLLKNEIDIEIPQGLKRMFPKRQILLQMYHYMRLKMKYFRMKFI